MSQASCSWTPEMVDSLVRIYGDTISNSGKAADNGSLSDHVKETAGICR